MTPVEGFGDIFTGGEDNIYYLCSCGKVFEDEYASFEVIPRGQLSNLAALISYTYENEDSSDVHTQYPTGMQVWTLENTDGIYTATHVEELDNILILILNKIV